MTIHDGATVRLSNRELIAVTNALNEVVNGPDAIEAWEFSTRVGVEPAEAKQLLIKLKGLLASLEGVDKAMKIHGEE